MKDQFIPYNLAVKLKELGFDEECLTEYMPNPFPPYEWKLQSIISTTHLHKSGQNDSHLGGFTGYKNTGTKHFGLKSISAPLWQQVFDWFRKNYDLTSWVYKSNNELFHYSILRNGRFLTTGHENTVTYEEARLECLNKLIELCKKKIT